VTGRRVPAVAITATSGRLSRVIVGIGVDVADTSRLAAALARTPALADRLFAEGERDRPVRSLASCFAAKEAVAKALGGPAGLRWTDASLEHDELGRPRLELQGTVAAAAARLGVTTWHVSISHDAGICVAMVIAERSEAVGAAPREAHRQRAAERVTER